MKIVILSGGSGKRLWPMSNDSRSKQFLKVLTDEHGDKISMLQRVWSQLKMAGLLDCAYICAPKAQHETIESQVGLVRFIEEPARRDTFPAVALASTYLADVAGVHPDEVVAVVPVDPFVDQTFFETLHLLEPSLQQLNADMALIGVEPTVATSKFGYIRIGSRAQAGNGIQVVDSFVEKPAQDLAASLIADGALWNCGVFAFRIRFMQRRLAELGLPIVHQDLVDMYSLLPKRSFDYEVVEHARNIIVVPYEGPWEDLGTWGSLSAKMSHSFVGAGASVGCENTHVINELGLPVVAMGLKDTMIVVTPDGILAADKESAADVKHVIEDYTTYPMFVERRWGTYRVLDYRKLEDGSEVLTKCIAIRPGKSLSYQKHNKRTEVWTIVTGFGEVLIGSDKKPVHPGEVIKINPGEWHAVCAHSQLEMIEVQCGVELTDEDIVRSELSWEQLVSLTITAIGV